MAPFGKAAHLKGERYDGYGAYRMRIVSIGEILWDVIGAAEYLGGAPLNFSAHAQKLGHEVFLVSAVGDDERGWRALEGVRKSGVSSDFIRVLPGRSTGTAEVELDSSGKPMFRIVRPAAYDFGALTPAHLSQLVELRPHWIYYGTLYHRSEQALGSTLKLFDLKPSARRLYDINLREGNWKLGTVERLASHANVIKLSDSEAECLDATLGTDGNESSVEHFCRRWCQHYGCMAMCVTFGERGCGIYSGGSYVELPGCRVEVADTIGAGDAFAAAFLHGFDRGWDVVRCGVFANAVAALVASRPGAIPDWSVDEVWPMLGGEHQALRSNGT